ncbi:MAG: hypothetical protein A3F82_00980 [Deltaproteobacteria bacterium RIFCSPLOWO2_12_FULL_44_12]|nr:MAG: hypothetical protein A2712_03975 [Deltaproteobacteria bacterium RIFCSPHIGHO2_01_FULL_43_49]OGQ16344.1 MAG: hypothetical protein A3D22_01945 [Deltaproteobacteria bacterium RIFCSPHIGHO2_02_FULL_44_53]OGQ29305.1 MAG: hypothetical protein A3D98_05730 [Deltaproteobacteria bacterium RIFCSPHIGHO2_12_FULL_44_21]OGQ32862.1 MAG: hypothetical protein A2979_09875 [Deltaproteobacteria bacterium RIFCSPLOWO2_01_FULL_45_74]OGQ41963.1 MAG: hypothetical protein A3I70_09660 [Deltaproteobacteria bacterium 
MRSDTSPEVQKHFDALCRQLSEEERFLKGLEWIRLNRELLLAGFRARFPHFSEEQIRKELMREVYQ